MQSLGDEALRAAGARPVLNGRAPLLRKQRDRRPRCGRYVGNRGHAGNAERERKNEKTGGRHHPGIRSIRRAPAPDPEIPAPPFDRPRISAVFSAAPRENSSSPIPSPSPSPSPRESFSARRAALKLRAHQSRLRVKTASQDDASWS